jgi:DNA-binding response OmpR family regulator
VANILCIDDETRVVLSKCNVLKSAGHTVTAATSVKQALKQLQATSYDVVVTAWRLGDGNGKTIIHMAKLHTIPVMVVSSYASEAFQAAEPLADIYLQNPVAPEELVNFVNVLLDTRGSRPAVTLHDPEDALD